MKLPRLQLHLSTCILLVLVASALSWLNVHPMPGERIDGIGEYSATSTLKGWPLVFRIEAEFRPYGPVDAIASFKGGSKMIVRPPEPVKPVTRNDVVMDYKKLAINVAVALAILGAVALAVEFVIQRSARVEEES